MELTQNSKLSSSEEEVVFSDENSDKSPLSSSPEYEIEHESDGAFASPSASEDEDAAAAFAEVRSQMQNGQHSTKEKKKITKNW